MAGRRLLALETAPADVVLLVARVSFGGVLAFTSLNRFVNGDEMAGYAETKDVPAAGGLLAVDGGFWAYSVGAGLP